MNILLVSFIIMRFKAPVKRRIAHRHLDLRSIVGASGGINPTRHETSRSYSESGY